MQPSFLLLVSAIASLQAISAAPLGGSQPPSQEHQPSTEEVDDSEMSGPMQTSQTSGCKGLTFQIYNHPKPYWTTSMAILPVKPMPCPTQISSIRRKSLIKPSTNYHHSASSRGGYKKYFSSARRHFKDTPENHPIFPANPYCMLYNSPQIRYSLRMRFITVGLAANQVAVAAPIGCSSSCTREYRRVHYRSLPCVQYATDYHQNVRVLAVFKTPNVRSPLLRQVFTTVTRKQDSLSIANANSNKGFNVKYQAGPSLKLEGRGNALEYAKQKAYSSFSPYVLMQPTQDVQYTTPVTET
ncbi:hypothetical protein K493DRAFT_309260 [Basidiobolus meristosporus CBS 931.73]|uniref:Uncharacterized protein n=1 Tax=Basidiobolus meristosporus CBS 931.73 TaxID=1314790 RepID=A0A1Y1WJZ2_9FUNG|nr:hypothetical protein K493DRAFT_309260 [Basidiobolus meristosporus CBS 931.73]|eukprot:ORX73424.1 hypothetical protein K493DRAFT_309260 [Basidiobolus meristosporus CBS 931.73]